jgi:hypothetical protein
VGEQTSRARRQRTFPFLPPTPTPTPCPTPLNNTLNFRQLVATLRDAGAIVIAKTNIPQTLFAFESVNPLWGRALNPWSVAHTPGGSSGGEGAFLAADGAALGIGSDIGGSIRIPAGYCGIYGLKPCQARVSFAGAAGASLFLCHFLRHRVVWDEVTWYGITTARRLC